MPIISSKAESRVAQEAPAKESEESEVPLMGSTENLVEHLGPDPFAVDAERINGEAMGGELQAPAVLPCEFAATLSDNYENGTSFTIQGPLGPIKVEPPADAKPGDTLRYRLGPKPEYRVQVPADRKPGALVSFQREDGKEVKVQVPEGFGPGDSFEVSPPCAMVRVPVGAEGGDFVVFQVLTGPNQPPERFRAQVPEGLEPGRFLTARLPVPKPSQAHPQRSQGWGAAWSSFRRELGHEVRDSIQLLRSFAGPGHKDVVKAAE